MNIIALVATFSTVALGGVGLTGKLQDDPVVESSKSKDVNAEVVSRAEIAPIANLATPAAPGKSERGVFVAPRRDVLPSGVSLIK